MLSRFWSHRETLTIQRLLLNSNFLRILILTIAAILSIPAIAIAIPLISLTVPIAIAVVASRSSSLTIPITITVTIAIPPVARPIVPLDLLDLGIRQTVAATPTLTIARSAPAPALAIARSPTFSVQAVTVSVKARLNTSDSRVVSIFWLG